MRLRWERMAALAVALVVGLAGQQAAGAAARAATRGYLLDTGARALVMFDPATNTVLGKLSFGQFVPIFDVRPDGQEIYVLDSLDDLMLVVSTQTNSDV